MVRLLAAPFRLLLIAAVALVPAVACCCLAPRAEATPAIQPDAAEHGCCATASTDSQTKPREDKPDCDCGEMHLSTPPDVLALVTVHAGGPLFDLPLLLPAVLGDLAPAPRPVSIAFDTPPPRAAQTLRAQHCLLLI